MPCRVCEVLRDALPGLRVSLWLVAAFVLGPLADAADPAAATLPPAVRRKVDFAREIQPLLQRACLGCHGTEKQRGGLRLDSGKATREGGNSGVVLVPGKSAQSRLIHLVVGLEPDSRMPPDRSKALTPGEIGLLRAWIDQGAIWPAGQASVTSGSSATHWAFQPLKRQALPTVKDRSWLRNGIDTFVLARLEKEGLAPSAPADRVTLFRRLCLDLLGLPPTPDEVEAFLADRRPDAYERAVDRLLASPHYGERWGRHWLDLARYADSDGYEKDTGRPHAWRWRHWVIQALNENMAYDRFTVEQLAGDQIPYGSVEQRVATGFHRNTLTNREGGVDREQFRVEAVVDRVNTTARVWLGLTLGCAQCHDHKYDPLSHREYYQFFAYFNSDVEVDIAAPVWQWKSVALPDAKKGQPSQGIVMAQTLASGKYRKTHVLLRSDFLRPGVEVRPGTPGVLPGKAGRTRLDLARWLVSHENPLTPRVTVNWVWQHFFGRGLVATPEDFGTQGEKPTHPELLDWLAAELPRRGWRLKDLHRLIVTSATYRQSSHVREDLLTRDPYNTLLARQSRQRLEAEVLRDVVLVSSGLLTRTIGGPSVRPPQPAGISELTYSGSARWKESTGADRYRRGLYTWFQRTSPYPMLLTFDAPDANLSCVRRERSNTPLQALTLLNDAVFVEGARSLAGRIQAERKETPERAALAFQLTTGRSPTTVERERLVRLHADLAELAAVNENSARALVGGAIPAGSSVAEAAAWVAVARAVLNLDEVVMRE